MSSFLASSSTTDSDATESDVTKNNHNHKYLNLDTNLFLRLILDSEVSGFKAFFTQCFSS